MRLMIAGGGTGGHLFPGLALADEVAARGGQVMFVGTERGIEVRAVPQAGYQLELITVSGLKRVGAVKTVQGLMRLPVSFGQCVRLLRSFAPDAVVGVGGYASGPVVMTARLMGYATAILEQNSIPGLTNRVLGRFVHRVFASFEQSKRFFPSERFTRVGNPVRAALLATPRGDAAGVLVLGGSQGARVLNQVVPDALAKAFAATGRAVPVLHQTGEKDVAETQARYERAGVAATVSAFIEDMGKAYADAALCICRSGATTCAELTALGKPSLLIPFQFAADDHQTHNAQELVDGGAAVMVSQPEASVEKVAELAGGLLSDANRLAQMSAAALALGRPQATADIADGLTALVAGSGGHNVQGVGA